MYKRYLSSTLNLNLSHATLAGAPKSVLGRFFCLADQKADPKYFDVSVGDRYSSSRRFRSLTRLLSFQFDSGADLAKLECSVDVQIVVVSVTADAAGYDRSSISSASAWIPVHDRRVFDLLTHPRAWKETRFYCLARIGKKVELYSAPDELGCNQLFYLGRKKYVERLMRSDEGGPCQAERMARLVGSSTSGDHEHDEFCSDLARFLFDWKRLER